MIDVGPGDPGNVRITVLGEQFAKAALRIKIYVVVEEPDPPPPVSIRSIIADAFRLVAGTR
jgi:hypothetical protein